MKYAFMSFSCPTLTLPEALKLVSDSGYDGFEIRIDAGHAHGIETDMPAAKRREARDMARDMGVDLACLATSVCLWRCVRIWAFAACACSAAPSTRV